MTPRYNGIVLLSVGVWLNRYVGVVYCRVQDQVSGVISVMRDNIGRVIERGDKLEDLEEKSGEKYTLFYIIYFTVYHYCFYFTV